MKPQQNKQEFSFFTKAIHLSIQLVNCNKHGRKKDFA